MRLASLATVIAGSALLLGLSAPAANAATSDSVASVATKEIVVAVEAPLSGSQADNGQDMLRGVELAVAQLNAKGGIGGRKVRIVELDDAADPTKAAAMVDQAKAAGAVAVVGPYNSSVGVINLPLYVKAGIAPVHMTSTNDTDGMGITVQPKNNQIAPVEAAYVLGQKATSVAMLVDPSTYTQGMADRLSAALKAKGVTVTAIPITEGKSDYSAEVAQALTGVPSMVYVSTYYPEGAKIAQSLAKSKLPTTCLMGLANVDPAFVTQAGSIAAERCKFSGVPAAAQEPGAAAKVYAAAYLKAFKKQAGVWSPFTYDSMNVLASAITKAKGTDYAKVMSALQNTKNFKGATGTISIDPKTGNRIKVPVYILKVDAKGNFVVTK